MGILYARDRGQVLLFTALLIPVLLGMTAVAVDVGGYADDKRNLQNAADAIALAAARDMCTPNPADCSNTSAAATTANAYATSNDIDLSTLTVQFLGGNTAPKVRVTIARPHSFNFISVLGVGAKGVSVAAAATKVSPGGIPGVLPFGVTQATIDAAGPGNDVVLKYDASGGSTSGNFGAIDIDGTGSPPYTTDLQHGSPSTICSQPMAGCDSTSCPGSFPSPCAEDAPSCTGAVCASEPGNKIGPTRTGINYRMNNTSAGCQNFSDVFTPTTSYAAPGRGGSYGGALFSPPLAPAMKQPTNTPTSAATNTPGPTNTPIPTATPIPTNTPLGSPTPIPTSTLVPTATPSGGGTGNYVLNPNCNPWGAGACPVPDTGALCSRRVIVVPIIDGFSNGKKPITILGFGLFFLEGYANGSSCTGNDCQVLGRFVKADVTMNALTGGYDPTSSVHFERLVE